jgi:BNR repeat-containing family member
MPSLTRLALRIALGAIACVLVGPAVTATGRGGVLTWARGSWSWFGDPRAVHVGGPAGLTFAGWIDWAGAITVGAFDPRFGALSDAVVGHAYHDDHSDPSLLVEPDGRLTVFWSGHNGARMYYRTTRQPGDIDAWTPPAQVHQDVPGRDGFTYPNPVLLPAEHNQLYLFFRGADWSVDFARRTPDGTWNRSHVAIRAPGQRPYLKVAGDGRDTIALALTDGHPRNALTSVYYAAYRHGSLWTAAGRWIARLGAPPIPPRRAQLVYDARAGGAPAWVWDVAFGRRRRPVIVYATFPKGAGAIYWYAVYNGRRWVSHRLTAGGGSISPRTIEYEYAGGLALDHSDPSVVYASVQVDRGWEIQRWTTPDGGVHWTHATVVPADATQNVRPVVPRGYAGGPMGLLWLRGPYRSYTTYRTSIAFLN